MKQNELNMNSMLHRNLAQSYSEIDGEVIMLNVAKAEYYNLEGTAIVIWNLLANPISLNSIIEYLIVEYNVSKDSCLKDVQPFIKELISKKIINVLDD